ncbi:MAG TPA: hypothetical protein VFL67_05540 [Mycobacterium sp.]|nr:hypothetical protein [Mycobacterium sp.]
MARNVVGWGWWGAGRGVRPRALAAGVVLVVLVGGNALGASASPGTGSGGLIPLPAARLLDTRSGTGAPKSPLPANGTVHLQVTGRGGVPASGVSAVVLNVTATAPTRSGYVTAYADGTTRPTASNLNYAAAQTVANLVIAPVGANGKVALSTTSTGTTALIADVSGYYLTDTTAPGPATAAVVTSTASATITLAWTNPTDLDLNGVMIRRATGDTPPASPSAGVRVADVPAPAASFADTGLAGSTRYSYAVFAHDAADNYATGATATGTTQMSLTTRALTTDGADTVGIELVDGVVTMTAPAQNNTLSNLRSVFWPTAQATAADEQVCATWLDQSDGFVQEGVALRVIDQPGRVRALTVTKNVIYGVQSAFNVHTWDTDLSQPFTAIGQYDMSQVVTADGQYVAFPWAICARVLGDQLTFKVWVPNREPEPEWNDAIHARTTTVPAGYLEPGSTGWYIGHIPAGGSAHYEDLATWTWPAP